MTTFMSTGGCQSQSNTSQDHDPEIFEFDLLHVDSKRPVRNPFARPEPTLYDALEHIWKATDNQDVKGILLRTGPLPGSWGSVEDLISALNEFRKNGRPVHCHFENADNVSYMLLATACDRASMSPLGTLDLVGPAAVMIYAKSLFDKIGVQAEIFHVGRYKNAGDVFVRNNMTPETKRSMDVILNDLYKALLTATKTRIGGDNKEAAHTIDRGPFTSSAAKEAKLIDAIAYLDDERKHIRDATGVKKIHHVQMLPQLEQLSLRDLLGILTKGNKKKGETAERIILVSVSGTIIEQELTNLESAASGPFVRAMERFRKDKSVKAIVLRIDSPGGSALASDRMWHAIRQLAQEKPVLASIGDVAASGGYYIASASDRIFAHPNSLVGSIGVIGGKFNIQPLTEKIGVSSFVLQRGANAAWSVPVRTLTETERKAVESLLHDTYDRFIERVAIGRDITRQEVEQAAQGRLMTGQEASSLKLVDQLGSLDEALSMAKQAGGLPNDALVEVWPPPQTILDKLSEMIGAGSQTRTPGFGLLSALSHYGPLTNLPLESWTESMFVLIEEHTALIPPFLWAIH